MAVLTFSCGDGSTFLLTCNQASDCIFFIGTTNPPSALLRVPAFSPVVFPCADTVYVDDNGVSNIGYVVLPVPRFPFEQVLLGLTGIICALLIAWAFNRS